MSVVNLREDLLYGPGFTCQTPNLSFVISLNAHTSVIGLTISLDKIMIFLGCPSVACTSFIHSNESQELLPNPLPPGRSESLSISSA